MDHGQLQFNALLHSLPPSIPSHPSCRRLSQGIVKAGCSLDETVWAAAGDFMGGGLGAGGLSQPRLLISFEDSLLEFLLAEFHFLEQVGFSVPLRFAFCFYL